MENYLNEKKGNERSVQDFWEKNEASYAGDILSTEIIRLSKGYIGKSVLDVGAGSGALISHISGAIGIDLAPKDPKVMKGDVLNMPFEDGRFDTVFASEVVEHLSTGIMVGGLKEIRRVLKNNGKFIITIPYKENINQDVVMCPNCGESFHRWGHLQSFDETKIKSILEGADFRIVKIRALPMGSMARHPFLKYFRWFFQKVGRFMPSNLFVISEKWTK